MTELSRFGTARAEKEAKRIFNGAVKTLGYESTVNCILICRFAPSDEYQREVIRKLTDYALKLDMGILH